MVRGQKGGGYSRVSRRLGQRDERMEEGEGIEKMGGRGGGGGTRRKKGWR